MSADWMLLAAGGVGLFLLALAARLLLGQRGRETSGAHQQSPAEEKTTQVTRRGERRSLAEVSRIWTGRGQVVEFREIARIWREPKATRPQEPVPHFQHEDIAAFHRELVAGRAVVKGAKKCIIEKLLHLLDTQGDCPSVVRRHKDEAEGKFDADVFALLARIGLREHSLAVARTLARRLDQPVLLPDALIIGLGHDLGKIPAYQSALYRTGDHPLVSLVVLEQISEFSALGGKDEIIEAIRQHHLLKPESPLGRAIKKADQQVRHEELGRLTRPAVAEEEGKSPLSQQAKEVEVNAATDQSAPPRAAPAPAAQNGEAAAEVLPSWCDAQAILAALKERINKLERGRWSVVSSPQGYVFAQPEALWSILVGLAGEDPRLLAAQADEERRRAVLLKVVEELAMHKAVATELLGAGYYATQAVVTMESGKSLQATLIPFRAEAFGTTPSMLEATKISRLRKMVQDITPGRKKEDACAPSS